MVDYPFLRVANVEVLFEFAATSMDLSDILMSNLSIRAARALSTGKSFAAMTTMTTANGDLNNISAQRAVEIIEPDAAYLHRSLAISENDDDPEISRKYRPFLLQKEMQRTDWIGRLELSMALKLAEADLKASGERLKILVLYGSLRARCVSQLDHKAQMPKKLVAIYPSGLTKYPTVPSRASSPSKQVVSSSASAATSASSIPTAYP